MRVILISTYELGRQPFGLASAAAWLIRAGHEAITVDLAVDRLDLTRFPNAAMFAFYLPMHTATRLAIPVIRRLRRAHPDARICAFGLYAPLNQDLLRSLGVEAILGGEFEPALVAFAGGQAPRSASLDKLQFTLPDRRALPEPARYAQLHVLGEARPAAYTEASRGCKHLCRHCPVVPVYQGQFRVVQPDVVLADIRQQIERGAAHVTFGDPDFFNGPSHARRIVEELHREFPAVTYDATIKIEHLLRHRDLLPMLASTGCILITTAVESLDDDVLAKLEKGHTRADFLEAVALCRRHGLTLSPTFIPFTPWTTLASYQDLLRTLADLDLTGNVAPVQLALRLLITSRSRLLELPDIREVVREFDDEALLYRWQHPDPRIDALARMLLTLVDREQKAGKSRTGIFASIWELAFRAEFPENYALMPRATVPYLDEPWYC
ncbi:MAG: radical SAM protein [Bryobacteraceae bacterium]|nr:radical SAM protein [Bryobacteraceae bacterium]